MIAAYQWIYQPSQLAWFEGGSHLALGLHSSNELGELSQ